MHFDLITTDGGSSNTWLGYWFLHPRL